MGTWALLLMRNTATLEYWLAVLQRGLPHIHAPASLSLSAWWWFAVDVVTSGAELVQFVVLVAVVVGGMALLSFLVGPNTWLLPGALLLLLVRGLPGDPLHSTVALLLTLPPACSLWEAATVGLLYGRRVSHRSTARWHWAAKVALPLASFFFALFSYRYLTEVLAPLVKRAVVFAWPNPALV
eukprot:TRINITY_DN6451_c0_g1_i1.p2 TRINITY_DN6451_c0_g1~~TRINITY_DN6451_c0_g1_i1.p2  ORF type:complete len:183 (+),score=63.23 TRINITY_DN6451_c0_g1_i1:150-698(+)